MRRTVHRGRGAAAAALALLLAACAADESDPSGTGDGSAADGAADGLVDGVASGKAEGWSAHEAELGGSYRFQVTPKQGDAVTPDNAKVLRFVVPAGQAFAASMRRTDSSELDAALILYEVVGGADSERVADSLYAQALLPMAVEEDGALARTAPADSTYLLYASDLDLAVLGSFQVDLVALDLPPAEPAVADAWARLDLSVTDPALRAYAAELRSDEAQLGEYLALGAVSEGEDGLLVAHEDVLDTLKDRHDLRLFTNRLNELRSLLFGAYAATVDSEESLLIRRIGMSCGGVWSALRTAEHALP